MDLLKDLTQPQAVFVAGLIGALGAILASLFANLISHALAFRAQDKRRWDEKRMEAYAEFARSVKRLTYLSYRLVQATGHSYQVEPLSLEDGRIELSKAEDERAARWESVLLLGDRHIVSAGRAWHSCARRMVDFALGRQTGPDDWLQAITDNEVARVRFYKCARRDLRVSRGNLPDPWRPPASLPEPVPPTPGA